MQKFEVSGMTCGHCVRAVTEAIHGLDAAAQVAAEGYPARPLAA